MTDHVDVSLEVTPVELKKESSQRPGDGRRPDVRPPEGWIQPPENPKYLGGLSQVSSTRRSVIEALARNTVGLGFTIGPKPPRPGGEELSADEAKALAGRCWDCERLLDELAAKDSVMDNPSFLGLLTLVKTDEEECGTAAIEVSRNRATAEVDGLYYVPGRQIRRRWERDGYMVIDDREPDRTDLYTHYKPFGAEIEIVDGKPQWKDGATKQNELLIFRLMSTESRDYGMPRDSALADDYLGDQGAAQTNATFFRNGGSPATVLFVGSEADEIKSEGSSYKMRVSLPEQTTKRILGTLDTSTDTFQGRVAVIPVPPGAKVWKETLSVAPDKDIGYTTYRDSVTYRILAAFRIGPVFLGIAADTSSIDPEVQRALAQEQVFDPEQGRYERRLSMHLLPSLGFDDLQITFKRMAIEGDAVRRESDERLAEAGAVTNAELRDSHGRPRLIEDGESVPEGWNDELVKPKAATQSTPTPQVNDAQDQRGERPGVGGRVPRGTENLEHPRQLAVAKGGDPTAAVEMSLVDQHQRRLNAARGELE